MQSLLGLAILMVFGSAYTVATIAWLAAVYCLWKTIANRHPGVPLWSAALGYFPPNIVFRPGLLTERGHAYRRRFGQAVIAFVAAVGAWLALDGLLRMLS
jgi:hypothetical protein